MGEKKSGLQGPVMIEAKVHLVNPDNGSTAVVTYSFPPGRAPSAEDVAKAIAEAGNAGKKHGMAPMGPSTFFNAVLVKRKTGRVGNFALPREMDFPEGLETVEYYYRSRDDEDELEDEDEE